MVKHGTMTTRTTSSTERADTFGTSLVVEDTGEDVGHDDEM